MRHVQGNRKDFYICIISKRKMRENVGFLLTRAGELVTKNMGKAEVPNALFTLVFTGYTHYWPITRPKFFNFFINDLDNGTECTFNKFVDDTNLGGRDLNRLEKCADRDLMKFHKGKCQVLHLGRNNIRHQLVANWLRISLAEKALEVLVNKLTLSQQCALAAKKSKSILGCIISDETHLECRVQFCVPQSKRDMGLLEQVQQQSTKMTKALKNLSYEERLRELGLFSLEKKGLRGDLIHVQERCKEDRTRLFSVLSSVWARGNGLKLKNRKFLLNIRKNFFTVRVIKHRSRFTIDFVASSSLEMFKIQLDTALHNLL
ncbi:hypothetical protein QYF61_020033 [Mycteria americana]|uniref:Reverse transcriptase domain-containing protein n=1 Tax=Mycteria americana TaxID=33587 RepID=A0AAN7SIU8_MYCAM|nr:hypothetical protein QYF61_020033 [Mycteria americana]